MADPFHEHPEGTEVDVWVVPGASRSTVAGTHGDRLKVRVAAPPEGGRANAAVERLLAAETGADRAEVVRGHRSRAKSVVLSGIDPRLAGERLGGPGG